MADFINLNESVKTAVRISQSIAREYYNSHYGAGHLLKALLHKEIGLKPFLESMDKDLGYFEEWAEMRIEDFPKAGVVAEILPDDKIPVLFEEADNVRLKLGLLEINPICVLAALARPSVAFTPDQLKSFPLRENEIFDLYVSGKQVVSSIGVPAASSFIGSEESGAMPLVNLMKYCVDKTALALDLKVHSIVSRDKETRMMMEILGRHSKPNVMIIGDSGVGKTALVDGLAHDIVNGKVPPYLAGAVVYELDTGALIAGATYKGEIEDRIKNIIKEIRGVDNAILFIDEIHVLLDSKQGNSGAANILKPELSKGDLTVIGATTIDEYRKTIEPDHAFSRRFEVLQVNEPDISSAILMMHSVLPRYSEFHKLEITKDAVEECVRLAKRYDKDRRLPDSAIDLMDRTMSATKMVNETAKDDIQYFTQELANIEGSFEKTDEEKLEDLHFLHFSMQNRLSPIMLGIITDETDAKEIEDPQKLFDYIDKALDMLRDFAKEKITAIQPHEIAAIISSKTGIPIGKVQAQEKERLLNMEDLLRRRVVGQDGALKSLVDAILESRSGLNKAGQPIGSFFLLGPTGTGKTELAKSLAEVLFNDEKAMIRFDMSEFKEEHSAALLYGAPPGYVGYEEGGLLVNKIRQQPYAVVLFDEIEKAHQSVYDIFLQIMDEGKLHDRLGKEGDFSNAIVLFTSNVGSQWLTEQLNQGITPETTQLMEVMGQYFRPEFLARLSEIVPFSPINETMLLKIFNIQLRSLEDALSKQGIELEVDDETRKMLSSRGFTPKYGARQIAGTIRTYLRRPISRLIVGNKLSHGQKLTVGKDGNDELTWDIN
ncbi:ATP-dependent Clp protease ATP-binding subunit [Dysgonomonas sp. 511]|uniref:ATP-dependent Clp protease ATP-binding subunit n=1 Tax=Dysgonomonas sp. 511 TaxID=2302930 RepID=UPI0013D7E98F|nr:ATP-dependent Clp protease ATP-binding subunit [Dysgonomonas sp. 511]NDV78474.1 ATP-dependent Clp protease ATP-binding subunit [Dysgonomonas sp. 511]